MTLDAKNRTGESARDASDTTPGNNPRTEIESLTRNDESEELTMTVTDWDGPFTATIQNIAITATTYVVTLDHPDGMYRLLAPIDTADEKDVEMETYTPSGWVSLTTVTDINRA